MKKIILILFVISIFCGNQCFAASFSVTPSEIYVIAGKQTVAFTCEVILSEEESPDIITIEIDYQDDDIVDDTQIIYSPFDGQVVYTFYHVFPTAGYWNTVVTFFVDDDRTKLDPVTINVARWRFPAEGTIGGIASTPAVATDGTIYVGSEDRCLYAINPDGSQKWSFQTGGPVNSSPVIDTKGNIYFASDDGYLYCLTPENPGTLWPRVSAATSDHIFSTPALSIDDGTLYIASTDAGLYAVDTKTGRFKWPHPFVTGSKNVSSPVVAHDGTIYVGSLDNYLYAVNSNGKQKWKINLLTDIFGSPSLDADGTIFIGTSGFAGTKDDINRLYAISSTGKEKWHVNVSSGFASTPVIDSSGKVVAGSYDNQLYAYDRNGGRLWEFTGFSDDILGASAIGSNGLIYTASKDGIICAVNKEEWDYLTGREVSWQYNMELPVTTSSPVIYDGTVYIGTCGYDSGVLWAFAAEPTPFNEEPDEIVIADPESPWPMMRNDIKNSGRTGFSSDTVAPSIVKTDPANGVDDLDAARNSISATFSKPVDPDLIYIPPTETSEGYYGFLVEPFEEGPEEFEIRWVSELTVELVLPPGVKFEKDVTYTAMIMTLPETNSGAVEDNDVSEGLLYPHTWTFSHTTLETDNYSGDRGCFISCLSDF